MKIERRKVDRRKSSEIHAYLEEVAHPLAQIGRVCDPSCDVVCPTCGAKNCACSCSSHCQYIPEFLTTDPNFPIEGKIAPLAFELKRLNVFQPCWSCEGHNDPAGLLWKIPRVWFYCKNIIFLRLLSDVLKDLEFEQHPMVPWEVNVTFSDKDNPDTTFSLEPVGTNANTLLADLQADVKVLTENVYNRVTEKAGVLMKIN